MWGQSKAAYGWSAKGDLYSEEQHCFGNIWKWKRKPGTPGERWGFPLVSVWCSGIRYVACFLSLYFLASKRAEFKKTVCNSSRELFLPWNLSTCSEDMLLSPKFSLSTIHVRLTAKGLLRNLRLPSGLRKSTVIFHTGLSCWVIVLMLHRGDIFINLQMFIRHFLRRRELEEGNKWEN